MPRFLVTMKFSSGEEERHWVEAGNKREAKYAARKYAKWNRITGKYENYSVIDTQTYEDNRLDAWSGSFSFIEQILENMWNQLGPAKTIAILIGVFLSILFFILLV